MILQFAAPVKHAAKRNGRYMWTDTLLDLLKAAHDENGFAAAFAFKQQHLPKRIYKYRCDTEYARENLRSDTIWLASPDNYNDPYDCFLRFSESRMTSAFERGAIPSVLSGLKLKATPEQIEAARQSLTPLQTLLKSATPLGDSGFDPQQTVDYLARVGNVFVEHARESLRILRSVVKICSFSDANNSILMWSHYANHHQGFCVEYDLEKFDAGDPFLKNLYPIIYSHQLFDLAPWAEKLVSGKADELSVIFPLLAVLQKFDGWAYEQEWRYVSFQEKATSDHARSMPSPSRVFLGARIPAASKDALLEICHKKGIPVSTMQMSNDQYHLVSEQIFSSLALPSTPPLAPPIASVR